MKRIFFILLLVISCTPINTYKMDHSLKNETTTIKEIVDGDTYVVNLNGIQEYVRVLGIDFPDITKSRMNNFLDYGVSRKRIKECYDRGKKEVEEVLLGKNVTLVLDRLEGNKDQYSRLIRYVDFNNTDIETWLLERGYARFLDPTNPWCSRCKNYYKLSIEKINSREGCLWKN